MYHLLSVTIKQLLSFSSFSVLQLKMLKSISNVKLARKSSDTYFPKVSITRPLLATGAEDMGTLRII